MKTLTKKQGSLHLTFAFLMVATLLFGLFSADVAQARWEPQQDTSPFDLYNHDKHTPLYMELGVDCEYCHRTEDSYNREKVYKMGCHFCHNNAKSPSKKAARYKCITCHKNLEKVKPEGHNLNWIARHQTEAKQNKRTCLKCHKGFFCTDCHQKRDEVDQRMHSRLFRYYHSIQARSNPRMCTNCHRVNFCKDCHDKHEN